MSATEEPEIGGHWYQTNPGNSNQAVDLKRAAQHAADNSGLDQALHTHREGVTCEGGGDGCQWVRPGVSHGAYGDRNTVGQRGVWGGGDEG